MASNPKKIKKVKLFIENHFPDATSKEVGGGEEYRFQCPFCHGGDKGEVSFDLNPHSGAARCWRASCAWAGSVEWFVSQYLDVDFPRAVEIVGGGVATSLEELNADLKMLSKHSRTAHKGNLEIKNDETVSAWIDGAVPFEEAPLKMSTEIKKWIQNIRGYDFEAFTEMHDIWVPPQRFAWEGRAMFSLKCEDNLGYLLYAMRPGMDPKTLNPHNKVLSNMLYKFEHVKHSPVVFICEGFFDAARILSWGLSATPLFSTYLSPKQIQMFSEMDAKELCICFDAGVSKIARKAANELAEYIPDKRISILRLDKKYLPKGVWHEGIDPDDLTEEQFLNLWPHRLKRLGGQEDNLKVNLMKLRKL